MRWLVITDVMTDEGMTMEVDEFPYRTDADRFATRQMQRVEVERVVVTDKVRMHRE